MELSTTTEMATDAASPSGMDTPLASFLFVVLHRDAPALGGARYDLTGVDAMEIGRGHAREAHRRDAGRLELRLPGKRISKVHARLTRQGDTWLVEDQGSRNGVFINGQRSARGVLRDRDFLEIGSAILRYRTGVPSPKGTATDLDSERPPAAVAGFATLLPALAGDLEALARIAGTPVTTLLVGESGTGKEVLASSVHELSGRPGPLIAINCGALTGSLLESQLFGHKKGAFTGALTDEPGLLRSAHTGTVLLDEIGDLPLPAQAALLRALQEREVVPVGDIRPVRVDLRVLSATHKPLDQMALRGEFRGDLLARLVGYRHTLPPLRERLEDLGLLIRDILRRSQAPSGVKLSARAARALLAHSWPFNIRELVQALTVATALFEDATVDIQHLPRSILGGAAAVTTGSSPAPDTDVRDMDPDVLRARITALLEEHRGNISQVARTMGKARMQIHRWLRAFDIDVDEYRS